MIPMKTKTMIGGIMKTHIVQNLSLRAKFKDHKSVEIVIINHDTGEFQMEIIPLEFNNSILKGTTDKKRVYRSKTSVSKEPEVKSDEEVDEDVCSD